LLCRENPQDFGRQTEHLPEVGMTCFPRLALKKHRVIFREWVTARNPVCSLNSLADSEARKVARISNDTLTLE
jgi:hypothetical protein